MPSKGIECQLGKPLLLDRGNFRSSLAPDNLIHFPADYRDLFRAFRSLNPAQQEAFFSAAALYCIGLVAGRNLPTLRLSYQVAAVDALIEGSSHTQRAFTETVQMYNPEVSTEVIEYLYGNIRSAHFHMGKFPLGEYQPIEIGPLSGSGLLERTMVQMRSSEILQPVLIGWLLDQAG
jgi:hypothetical protein